MLVHHFKWTVIFPDLLIFFYIPGLFILQRPAVLVTDLSCHFSHFLFVGKQQFGAAVLLFVPE